MREKIHAVLNKAGNIEELIHLLGSTQIEFESLNVPDWNGEKLAIGVHNSWIYGRYNHLPRRFGIRRFVMNMLKCNPDFTNLMCDGED